MNATGQSQISLSDPDARYRSGKVKAGASYNVQIAVDCKHKLIVEQEVCTQVGDLGLLAKPHCLAFEVCDRLDMPLIEHQQAVERRGNQRADAL